MSNLFEQLSIVKAELAKLEDMLHGNMLQLLWDKAPEWAQWAAMDSDGEWFVYHSEPVICDSAPMWDNIAKTRTMRIQFPPCTNWKESKRKRP